MTTQRRTLLAFAAALLVAPSLPARAAGDGFERGAFDAAIAAGEPVLVDITAAWCPVCRVQQDILADLSADPKFAGIRILAVDFDAQKDVVRSFGARSQSTLILFADGKEVGRSVGDTDPARIAALLEQGL